MNKLILGSQPGKLVESMRRFDYCPRSHLLSEVRRLGCVLPYIALRQQLPTDTSTNWRQIFPSNCLPKTLRFIEIHKKLLVKLTRNIVMSIIINVSNGSFFIFNRKFNSVAGNMYDISLFLNKTLGES